MEPDQLQLNSLSMGFVEDLYLDFLRDPDSVPENWRAWFADMSKDDDTALPLRIGPSFRPRSVFNPPSLNGASSNGTAESMEPAAILQERVDQLVRAYRERGHFAAQLDPLEMEHGSHPELDPGYYGLKDAHLDIMFSTEALAGRAGTNKLSLRKIIERLHNTYSRTIGVQFMHIDSAETRNWLIERMEGTENRLHLDREQQLRILRKLSEAVVLEYFIQKKYPVHKRFSLEGGESLMPLLQLALECAAEQGVEHVVMGMAHRGRLDVLANIIGMPPSEIFREFEGNNPEYRVRRGDVKYHLGHSARWRDDAGHELQIDLSFNPSHLEYVDPVVLGRVRAIQDRMGDSGRERSMALLIHGDAAFAGEGIVQETLNMADLAGYSVGGTVHIIINNQIGFTTSPSAGRSAIYCTGVAKLLQVPIFHVNGEDPEAVAQVVSLAMDFRHRYKQDVFIDMYCYRRWGHNEGDEPSYTQPLMYEAIRKRRSVRESYLEKLIELGGVTRQEADAMAEAQRAHLDAELAEAKVDPDIEFEDPVVRFQDWHGGPLAVADDADTAVDLETLKTLLAAQTQMPPGFSPHPKLAGPRDFLTRRAKMATGELPLDWSAGEALAFASLAVEGHRIRLSGQDVERGTFSHRHAVLHDFRTGERYLPLAHLTPDQAPVEIYNSPLSEAGVLGFEYGYSVEALPALVAWEAQFGDFINAAQVIVDQFIASAEDKWKYLSGLVLLLPHAFEGIGPEHSSARLERFLTLAAGDNMQIANVTTPAQYFHLLRRQVVRGWRKPLIVMSPKSLLRHPEALSSLEELASGQFQPILPDAGKRDSKKVSQVILCSGKIYYELAQARRELKREDIAILRLEQYYPFSDRWLREALATYRKGVPVVWVQEEPENMGAWRFLLTRFGYKLFGEYPFSAVTRAASASPATGSARIHEAEQKRLIERAFGHELPDEGVLQLTQVNRGFAS